MYDGNDKRVLYPGGKALVAARASVLNRSTSGIENTGERFSKARDCSNPSKMTHTTRKSGKLAPVLLDLRALTDALTGLTLIFQIALPNVRAANGRSTRAKRYGIRR